VACGIEEEAAAVTIYVNEDNAPDLEHAQDLGPVLQPTESRFTLTDLSPESFPIGTPDFDARVTCLTWSRMCTVRTESGEVLARMWNSKFVRLPFEFWRDVIPDRYLPAIG
jgi:hypothetical protein